ncbi:MAG: D-glycero-beta-D-manno-heptose 1,7-bisphosphate 7-phosphatase [Nitrospirota bacterium]|nr:MAG: D-glycero-beta-D-manno-heptose 1,7-bisphosphate 7-phosphatase [Nitrospirota bacterium]
MKPEITPTVFLDRDGTLNRDTGYITSPAELNLFPGVVEAIVRLKQGGSRVVIITNQSGIARGLMTEDDLHMIHRKLERELVKEGGCLDGIFFCSHHPDDACQCRKPKPGLILRAAKELDLNLSRSYYVGDKVIDMQLANAVGSKAVLVMTSEYSQEAVQAMENNEIRVAFVAENFSEAANWILQDTAAVELN